MCLIQLNLKVEVKSYGFFYFFAKNMGTHPTKVAKKLSNKFSKKLLENAKKFTTGAIKTASKRTI